ncbi:MAG: hypothetical protein ABEJ55_03950 [Halanaeroarchaeum sp.]
MRRRTGGLGRRIPLLGILVSNFLLLAYSIFVGNRYKYVIVYEYSITEFYISHMFFALLSFSLFVHFVKKGTDIFRASLSVILPVLSWPILNMGSIPYHFKIFLVLALTGYFVGRLWYNFSYNSEERRLQERILIGTANTDPHMILRKGILLMVISLAIGFSGRVGGAEHVVDLPLIFYDSHSGVF